MTLPEVLGALPRLVGEVSAEDLAALAGKLREAELLVELRLRSGVPPTNGNCKGEDDRNLSAQEAALRLGVSRPYLYKHANSYPFARRIGKRVLFSAVGLETWNRGRHPGLTVGSLEG